MNTIKTRQYFTTLIQLLIKLQLVKTDELRIIKYAIEKGGNLKCGVFSDSSGRWHLETTHAIGETCILKKKRERDKTTQIRLKLCLLNNFRELALKKMT